MFLLFLTGCLTAKNYPDQNAETFCETMYMCIDNDDIETYLKYDNQEECAEDIGGDLKNSDEYKDWENGNKEFNKEKAESCLAELLEIQSDADCDGSMNALSFGVDAYSEDCFEVYE